MIDHDDRSPAHDDALESLVRAGAPESFSAGFADRVVARLRAEREGSVSAALERQFRRVVPILAAASLLLAAYNWWNARESSSSALEAALNLPRVTLSAAYEASLLYGDANTSVGTP
jgi:hypothetical protein